jgi:ABC-type nickel/cobalt efflux system permease component RcnA
MQTLRSLSVGIAVGLCFAIAAVRPAAAHPLGNFTINHLSKLRVGSGRVSVRYVLDMAEIPTFGELRRLERSGKPSSTQLAAWAEDELRTIQPQLEVRSGDKNVSLVPDTASVRLRPGAGGLPTLYFVADYHAALPPPTNGRQRLDFSDRTFDGRLGWIDVVGGADTEPTRELTAYPNAELASPRNLRSVQLDINGALVIVHAKGEPVVFASAPTTSAARSNALSDMLARGSSNPWTVFLTLLIAIGLGALHALEPGHGKTLLAVSLVGARATVRQASILAGALTVAHTAGVLVLGIAINIFKGYFVPETIYPWITLGSGIVIVLIGARAVQRQLQLRQPFGHVHVHDHAQAHPHTHDHIHAAHDGDDGHGDLEHARLHALPGTAPLRFSSTVWAAMSGGIAPCPAALVVLLAAVALDQVAYGILVIVAFSFGLAATLTATGIAVVRGASWLQARPQFDRVARYGPLVSAIVIATIGSVMVGQGVAQQGFSISPALITTLVAIAITGYAFSHPFSHGHREQAA